MTISIRCKNPGCGKACRVKDESAGKSIKCPGCGQRIMVPSLKLASPAREPGEESAPQIEPPAPRLSAPQTDQEELPIKPRKRPFPTQKDPDRPVRRAVWPWLVGMAAMLLVGAGGGYFLMSSQARKSEDRPAQTDLKSQELAVANADLTKRLSAAEGKVTDALAANADLTKRLSAAEERVRDAERIGKPNAPPAKEQPLTPAANAWEKAFGIKLVLTIKKANLDNVDVAKLPKSDGLDYDKMLLKSQLAMAKGIGESTEVKTPGEFGVITTLRIGRDDSTAWPNDGKPVENMHLWGQVLVGKQLLRYNLLLSGTQTPDGFIRGKAVGSTADGFNFQNANFEMRPVRDEFDRD